MKIDLRDNKYTIIYNEENGMVSEVLRYGESWPAANPVNNLESALVHKIVELEARLAAHTPVWSKEKPTVPGWYWWDTFMWGFKVTKIVEVAKYEELIYVVGFGPSLDLAGQWAGPIASPRSSS